MRPPGKHRRRRAAFGALAAFAVLTAAAIVVTLFGGQHEALADVWWY
jgi:hypothetical protein